MPITFQGSYPARSRVMTGCMSLDLAVSGIDMQRKVIPGLPMRCGYHIWSKASGLGKTHLALSLLGKIAASTKKAVAVSPIDTFDLGNLESILNWTGMDGVVNVVLSSDGHAQTMQDLNDTLAKKGVCASLLDSAYAVMSTAVEEGGTEDANMGRDAKMVSTYARQAKGKIDTAKEDKVFIVTNMSFADIGARRAFGPTPFEPARGRTLMGMTSIHIDLSQGYVSNKPARYDKGRLVTGKVKKNNFGPTDREFSVFIIGGLGIHDGITASYDCVNYGLATMKGSKFVLDGEIMSTPEHMMDDYKNDELFAPFITKLQENKEAIYAGEIFKAKSSAFSKKKVETMEDDDEIITNQSPEELQE